MWVWGFRTRRRIIRTRCTCWLPSTAWLTSPPPSTSSSDAKTLVCFHLFLVVDTLVRWCGGWWSLWHESLPWYLFCLSTSFWLIIIPRNTPCTVLCSLKQTSNDCICFFCQSVILYSNDDLICCCQNNQQNIATCVFKLQNLREVISIKEPKSSFI